ncbi:phospholipase [Annulohypoxylon maeteangense]|uniref:phospholipase n=1 Tax=Annulohypoxylon maeteangense TaxID=1927788 RepID=UPI002007AB47|nr:phospholipase [Annulohypoxylon maeteangense]KAI0886641.1 phospholipase [Annulohypoxylon maeteangense]
MSTNLGSGSSSPEFVKLLSIDGGGIRGLSSLVLLEQLMDNVNFLREQRGERDVEPWEVFDMIGGCSTGGLIAVMLGRLRMSVAECKNAYIGLANKAFTPVNLLQNISAKASLGPRFRTEFLESAIKDVIGEDWEHELLKEDRARCKVFVAAHIRDIDAPVCLRSYRNIRQPSASLNRMLMWEACRATSAAQTFFDSIVVDGVNYSDGGLHYNNPVHLVHSEASNVFEGRQQLIISLGTGKAGPEEFNPNLLTIAKQLARIATDTEKAANDFARQRGGEDVRNNRYFRFNLENNGKIGIEEAKKIRTIGVLTEQYLGMEEVSQKVRLCAEQLALGA